MKVCARCGRALGVSTSFRFPSATGDIAKCRACSLRHRPMLGRSLRVALVVGTVLTIINQGDSLLLRPWTEALLWKIPLTFMVPFCVATWGALTSCAVRPAQTQRTAGQSRPHGG
jgi:hypothetical protein